jgi:hypothetical protein
MDFPKTFDAYIPSNGPNFLSISNINPNYVPVETLSTITISDPASTASFVYARKVTPPAVLPAPLGLASVGSYPRDA